MKGAEPGHLWLCLRHLPSSPGIQERKVHPSCLHESPHPEGRDTTFPTAGGGGGLPREGPQDPEERRPLATRPEMSLCAHPACLSAEGVVRVTVTVVGSLIFFSGRGVVSDDTRQTREVGLESHEMGQGPKLATPTSKGARLGCCK